MIEWLTQNAASIVLLIVVVLIIFVIARNKIRQRKQGTCSCGCSGCSGCMSHKKGGSI